MTLGGGGHPGAGGCHMNGDLVATKEKVVRALEAAFNRMRRDARRSRRPTPRRPELRSRRMRWMLAVRSRWLACGDARQARRRRSTTDVDASPTPRDMTIDANPNMPATLLDTGLCVDAACTQISAGIYAYTPRFALWADGATKRRWIYLPPGTQIDTTDMDHWEFPVGTKLWKEFTRGRRSCASRRASSCASATGDDAERLVLRRVRVERDAGRRRPREPIGVHERERHAARRPAALPVPAVPREPAAEPRARLRRDPARLRRPTTRRASISTSSSPTAADANPPTAPTRAALPAARHRHDATAPRSATCTRTAATATTRTSHGLHDNGITMELRLTVGTLGTLATTPVYRPRSTHDATVDAVDGADTNASSCRACPTSRSLIDRFESTEHARCTCRRSAPRSSTPTGADDAARLDHEHPEPCDDERRPRPRQAARA